MIKKLNVMLQVVLALILCGIVWNQSKADISSSSTLIVLIMSGVLCALIVRFFRSLWFYLTMGCLALGFLCASKFSSEIDGVTDGSLKLMFIVFMIMGVLLFTVGKRKFAPVLLKWISLPLGAWIVIVCILDASWLIYSVGMESAMGMIKIELIALSAGSLVGMTASAGMIFLRSNAGLAVSRSVFVEGVLVSGSAPKVQKPSKKLAKNVKRQKRARSKPSKAVASRKPASRNPVSSRSASSNSGASAKSSVLDQKLAALCSGSGAPKSQKKNNAAETAKKKEGSSSSDSSKTAEKTTTETGKIVSSVDFS